MLESVQDLVFKNREHAGLLLGHRLIEYEKTNTIVIGIPNSGVRVAAEIAKYLSLPLEVLPCKQIRHPADDSKALGSVSLTEVVVPDRNGQIPQGFVAHQIAMLKKVNASEYSFYYDGHRPLPLKYKTVIVVDDLLRSSEAMLASIREIKKQTPLKIIAAIPIVSAGAARQISAEVDDLLFLRMENEIGPATNYFHDSRKIDRNDVKRLLHSTIPRK
jgi:putative phosphoribosyl transferase